MYSLNESQFLKLMPFIGGEKSEDGQDKLVDEFIRLREQQTNKNRHIDAVRSLLLLDAPSKWEKLYPDSFFISLMNLHGQEFNGNKSTPSYCAAIIRRWIYEIVLSVELLHETNTCRGAAKRHCWFTRDNGRATLLSQIAKVEMVARMSQSRADFEANCARSFLEAPEYLSFSEPKFNEIVRPFVTEIRQGRMVMYDRLDLDAWVDQFKAANGRPAKENLLWQKEPQVLERKVKSGTLKKLSPVSLFDAALEKRNSNRQNGT